MSEFRHFEPGYANAITTHNRIIPVSIPNQISLAEPLVNEGEGSVYRTRLEAAV